MKRELRKKNFLYKLVSKAVNILAFFGWSVTRVIKKNNNKKEATRSENNRSVNREIYRV